MYNEARDSYGRDDNYNVHGVFMFFAMKIRQPFLQIEGVSNDAVQLTCVEKYTFSVPMSPCYTHELMLPLLEINLRSRSSTLNQFAQETAQMVAYFTQTAHFEKIPSLGRPVAIAGDPATTPALNLVYRLYRGSGDPEGTPMSAESTALDLRKVKTSKTRAI